MEKRMDVPYDVPYDGINTSVEIRDEGGITTILPLLHPEGDRGCHGSLQTGGYLTFV